MPTSKRICRDGNSREGNTRFLSHRSKINNKIPDLAEVMETAKKLLQLELDCNYQITQINGQRKFGPPLNWTGPAPDPTCEVFVGGIPRTIFEPDLYPVFSLIGCIYEIRLMMDFSGMNRGFGFVMYTKPEDAYHAVKKLNHYEICPGHKIGVVNSINHCRLHIKQLSLNIEAETVVQRIYDITDEVNEVRVYRNIDGSECYALISYKTHRGTAIGRKRLVPLTSSLFSNSKVVIDWANPSFYPTNVFEERGTCDEDGNVTLTKTFIPSTERHSKSTQKLSKIGELTFGTNENYNVTDNSKKLDESLTKELTRSRCLPSNFAKDFVKPSKSNFQGRGKIIPAKTSSSKIVLSNGCCTSNLNSHTSPFFQQNSQIFNSNNIEGSSFQNNLTSNHITNFNGPNETDIYLNLQAKTSFQPKEDLWQNGKIIQSYPFSQTNSILQSSSNLNNNSNQNDSTNLDHQNQTNNPWYSMYLSSMPNHSCPKQQTHQNFNINNLQDVHQNQLVDGIYNSQNIIYKNIMKYNNMTNANASYSLWPVNNHFEQEDNNCTNLINPSKFYVQKQFSSDCDQNNNVFNILKYSQGRPILKKKL